MRKRIIALLVVVLTVTSFLCACGSGGNNPGVSLGETVGTDICELTLNRADLTIALDNTNNLNYFTPKEYDAANDNDNPYVAAKGHTLVAFTYTLSNLDRAEIDVDGSFNPNFITIKYDGKSYKEETKYGAESEDGLNWEKNNSSNVLLLAGEKAIFRAYIDIPVEPAALTDTFEMIFSLPNSDGKTEDFKYTITAEARTKAAENGVEITLEYAVSHFTKEEGQDYFKKHIGEYTTVPGDQIMSVILNNKWKVSYIYPGQGSWTGDFWFQTDGRIKDTYGYVNERTWAISGDNLIINGEKTCELKSVAEGIYLLAMNGEPYILMHK